MSNLLSVLDGNKDDVEVAVELAFPAFLSRLEQGQQVALAWLNAADTGFGRFRRFIKNEDDRERARQMLLTRAVAAGALSCAPEYAPVI